MSFPARRTRRSFAAVGLVLGLVFVVPEPAYAVEPHAGLQIGAYVWPAFSNRNQVEADTLPGLAVSLLLGVTTTPDDLTSLFPSASETIAERLSARVELEVAQRFSAIHGVNDELGQRTADGQTLYATSILANFWPAWSWGRGVSTYAGGGPGVSWVRALGSDAAVFSVQTGAGVLVELPFGDGAVHLDLGWRSLWSSSVQLTAGRTDFDAHGGVLGIQIRR